MLMSTDEPLPTNTETTNDDTPDALREQIAARDAHLQDIAANISHTRHELNNLLTGILGQAQLILLREELTSETRRRLMLLEDLAKRMKEAVARLNDVQSRSDPSI